MSAATYAACLTPPGTGAIAVIAVHGPQALSVIEPLFHSRLAGRASDGSPHPSRARPANDGRFILGKFGEEIADEVVLSVKQVDPVPSVEIHCHGGAEVVRMVLETLQARGVEICSWQQLEEQTADDPLRAAAAIALAEARTMRTAGILLDQYHGAFRRAVQEVITALDAGDTASAARHLEELARHTDLGRHLTRPWRVVVAGPPNVGKSSLVNALAGYQRAVVSPVPGTTRDVVTTEIAVDGWPVELADTAGLRDSTESLEAQGIDRARRAADAADLCLWLLDASTPPVWPTVPWANVRFVVNKVDLSAAWNWTDAVPVSATTGEGIGHLCESLAGWLVPKPPAAGAAVPFTPALCDRVEEAGRRHAAGDVGEARRILANVLGR